MHYYYVLFLYYVLFVYIFYFFNKSLNKIVKFIFFKLINKIFIIFILLFRKKFNEKKIIYIN